MVSTVTSPSKLLPLGLFAYSHYQVQVKIFHRILSDVSVCNGERASQIMVFISLVSGNIFRILNITFLEATISELELRGLELMIFYGSLPLRRCNSETEF